MGAKPIGFYIKAELVHQTDLYFFLNHFNSMYIKSVFYQFTINLFRYKMYKDKILYDLIADIKKRYGTVSASKISTLQVGYSVPNSTVAKVCKSLDRK